MAKLDYSVTFRCDHLEDGLKYTDHNKMSNYKFVVLPDGRVLLYLRWESLNEGKPVFLNLPDGDIYDADEVMEKVGSVTSVYLRYILAHGDARPVFETEEEAKAYEASLEQNESI